MKRREFITLIGGAAVPPLVLWPFMAGAQQAARPARIGLLAFGQPRDGLLFNAFREEMRRLGHVEGGTYVLEFRSANGDPDRLQAVAAELIRLPVDVILTDSGSASIAAKHATAVIPVVMAVVGDPVGIGLVSSLARPGGNVTGFSILSPQLGSKRLALLKEAFPDAKLVGVLVNPASPATAAQQLASIKDAAAALGVEIVVAEARDRHTISRAIDSLAASRVSAFMVVGDATFFAQRRLIVDRAAANRLPGIHPEREYAEAGGLISYGPSVPDNFRRAAGYVVRILRGDKPGDLPVEQPVKYELVINLRTANAIGIFIPPAFPLRADEVIE